MENGENVCEKCEKFQAVSDKSYRSVAVFREGCSFSAWK